MDFKTWITFLFFSLGCITTAQTGIGTVTPSPSAKLEIAATDKGFLPPRLALTATNAASPVTAPATGLMVYNTTSNGNVEPGYYFWNSTSWLRLIVPTDNSANVTGTVAVANGGTGTTTGSITGSGAVTYAAGGTNQNVILTPSGSGTVVLNGNVGVGISAPVDRLDVRSAMSVNEIKFRNLDGGDDTDPYRLRKFQSGGSNELQLHLNDDSNERFSIYGNSCAAPGGCGEYSSLLLHYFRSDGDAYHSGRLGIGTTSPSAPLHVASSVSQYVTTFGFLNSNGAGSGSANTNALYSIQADQRIRAAEFNAFSDARIKTIINKLNTKNQLAALNKLELVNYSYIDKLKNGTNNKSGFIAQQVEKVNSQFVNQSTEFIPSFFALAKSAKIENEALHVSTDKPHGFQKGDEVKFFAEGKKEIIKIIEEVTSATEFVIKGWNAPIDNLFIYGQKVTDFRAIDFDQITALSVGAIQELNKQIQNLKRENARLNSVITKKIEAKQSEIEQRLLKLEAKITQNKR